MSLVRARDTSRLRIVPIRDGSASSWRPENASTREWRSSIVTGASTSASIALASANRSPEGIPPSISSSVVTSSSWASTRRMIAASCTHPVPGASARSGTSVRTAALVTDSSNVTGARRIRPAHWPGPSASSKATVSGGSRSPTPSSSACGSGTMSSSGSWIATRSICLARSLSPTSSSSMLPRSSSTRPRLARGWSVMALRTPNRTVHRYPAYFVVHDEDSARLRFDPTGLRGDPLRRHRHLGQPARDRRDAEPGARGNRQVPVIEHERLGDVHAEEAVRPRGVAGKREAGERGERDVGGTPEAGLDHARRTRPGPCGRRTRRACAWPPDNRPHAPP